jgi:hypothetical protein
VLLPELAAAVEALDRVLELPVIGDWEDRHRRATAPPPP